MTGAAQQTLSSTASEASENSTDSGRPEEISRPVTSVSSAKRRADQYERLFVPDLPTEARERAQRARENLRREGRRTITVADCSDLVREAFRPRWPRVIPLPPPANARRDSQTGRT